MEAFTELVCARTWGDIPGLAGLSKAGYRKQVTYWMISLEKECPSYECPSYKRHLTLDTVIPAISLCLFGPVKAKTPTRWRNPLHHIGSRLWYKFFSVFLFLSYQIHRAYVALFWSLLLKIIELGAGEMAQRVRAPTALLKVLSSNPSNHMVAHSHP